MTTETITLTTCDKCHDDTENPKVSNWFVLTKPDGAKLDICLKCGHEIKDILMILGISFEFICKEYSDKPGFGRIDLMR